MGLASRLLMQLLESLKAASECLEQCFTLADVERPEQPALFVNRKFKDLTGYEDEEILGKNFRVLQGALTSRTSARRLSEAIRAREAVHQDLINYTKAGRPFWNRMILVPCVREGHLFYFGIQLDVTERKDLLIGAPVNELSAEQASHHELCHRFRNPLTALINDYDLLEGDHSPVKLDRLLQHMARAIREITEAAERLPWKPEPIQPS